MNVPPEILYLIFSFLNLYDINVAKCVCKEWEVNLRGKKQIGKLSPLHYFMRFSNLPLLMWYNPQIEEFDKDIMPIAAQNGNIEMMEWLFDKGCPLTSTTLNYAILQEKNTLKSVKWLTDNYCNGTQEAIAMAAFMERLDIMKLLHSAGYACTELTLVYATYRENYEIIDWIYENLRDIKVTDVSLLIAMETGSIVLIEYILNKWSLTFPSDTYTWITTNNDLPLLRYIFYTYDYNNSDSEIQRTSVAIKTAIEFNNYDMLDFMIPHGFPVDDSCFVAAVESENTLMINHLHSYGYRGEQLSMYLAAVKNHDLRMCYYLLKHDYPLDSPEILKLAAKENHYALVEWFCEYNCAWNPSVLHEAALAKDPNIFRKLVNVYHHNPSDHVIADNACFVHDVSFLEYLQSNNYQFSSAAIANAIMSKNSDTIEWILRHVQDIEEDALLATIFTNNTLLMSRILPRIAHITGDPIHYATEARDIDILDLLIKDGYPIDYETVEYSIMSSPIDIMDTILLYAYLDNDNDILDDTFFDYAVMTDNLEKVKILNKYCTYKPYTAFLEAIRNDNINILEWLYNNEFELTIQVFSAAVTHGNIQIIDWLIKKECPRDMTQLKFRDTRVKKWLRREIP